jgi:hypothetical protein
MWTGTSTPISRTGTRTRQTVRIPAEVRAVEPFLAKLPPAAAAVLSAFDRRGRSGAMPQFLNRSGVEGDFRPLNQPGALEPEAGLPAGL